MHSIVLGIPQSNLRQWRAIALPSHLVRRNETNQLSLVNLSDEKVIVHGVCKNHSFLPSLPPDAISLAQTLRLNATTAPKPGSLSGSLVVPAMPIANYIKVQLSGRARLNSGDGRIGVKLLLVNADGTKFMPLAVPDYVTVSSGWSEFKFQDYVPTSVLGGAVRAVTVELSPVPISQSDYGSPAGSSHALIKELVVKLQPIEAMDLGLGY